jgi:hypothetical protein
MPLRGKQLWQKLLEEQRQWIEKCGGDFAGHIFNYPTRSLNNVKAIYDADIDELRHIEWRLSDHV